MAGGVAAQDHDGLGPGGRHRGWRIVAGAVILVAAVAAVTVALAITTAQGARHDLLQAQAHLQDAKNSVAALDLEQARLQMARAQGGFAAAADRMDSPGMQALQLLPVVGPNVATVRVLAQGGRDVTAAGQSVVSVIQQEGGLDAFAPADGRVPVDVLQRLHPPLDDALLQIRRAADAAATTPEKGLAAPVRHARTTFLAEVAKAEDALAPLARLSAVLPAFLGADGPRQYFLGAQNPAEQRGTGGLIGAYAVLTVDDGTMRISDFSPVQDLANARLSEVQAPDVQFANRYNRFGGAVTWLNINVSAHFPWVGEAITNLYSHVTGDRLDGVIVVDPQALSALLTLSGPVPAPTGGTVTADTVVEYVANEAYDPLQPTGQRKRLLGDVAGTAFHSFLDNGITGDPDRLIDAFADIASQGHLLVYSDEPFEQSVFVEMEIAGVQGTPSHDYLSVVANNFGANKADFYVDRSVRYEIALQPDGSAEASLAVELANETPVSGLTEHVIGPNMPGLQAGDSRTLVSAYCGRGCTDVTGGDVQSERGLTVATQLLVVPSEEHGTARFSWTIRDAWDPGSSEGEYRLTYQDQVTIRPSNLEVVVTIPEHATITGNPDQFVLEGRTATWTGTPARHQELAVRFRSDSGR